MGLHGLLVWAAVSTEQPCFGARWFCMLSSWMQQWCSCLFLPWSAVFVILTGLQVRGQGRGGGGLLDWLGPPETFQRRLDLDERFFL